MGARVREGRERVTTEAQQPRANGATAAQSASPDETSSAPGAESAARWYLPCFIAILVIAAFLRLYHLGSNPPEIFEDEISGAASAWEIVTTGHDVERTWLP